MDLGLTGKVAMVAAASKGIGLACAKLLAAEGCKVSICARNEEQLELAASSIGEDTRSYVVDIANPDDIAWWVQQTQEDLGVPTILVTNTGGPPAGPLDTLTDDQWLSGVRLVNPGMQAEGWGRIVHITSLVAKEPSQMLPISSTLRSGIMGLTRNQATEYAPFGITVNGVLPGHTLTDRQTHLAQIVADRDSITVDEALARTGASIPVGRLASPEEIAAAVGFLCSQQASYITGTSLLVDGGLTKGLG